MVFIRNVSDLVLQ